jgi:hypothetical protein
MLRAEYKFLSCNGDNKCIRFDLFIDRVFKWPLIFLGDTEFQSEPVKLSLKIIKPVFYFILFLNASVNYLSGRRIMSERTLMKNQLRKFANVASPYREIDLFAKRSF